MSGRLLSGDGLKLRLTVILKDRSVRLGVVLGVVSLLAVGVGVHLLGLEGCRYCGLTLSLPAGTPPRSTSGPGERSSGEDSRTASTPPASLRTSLSTTTDPATLSMRTVGDVSTRGHSKPTTSLPAPKAVVTPTSAPATPGVTGSPEPSSEPSDDGVALPPSVSSPSTPVSGGDPAELKNPKKPKPVKPGTP